MAVFRASARASRWSVAPLLLAAIASNGCGSSSTGTEPGTSPYTLGPVERVADADDPASLVTDGDTIFWTEEHGRIGAIDKAGGAVRFVVSNRPDRVGQLAIDGDRIVFIERFLGVSTVPKTGGPSAGIASNSNTSPYGLAIIDNRVYWENYGDSESGASVFRTELDGDHANETFVDIGIGGSDLGTDGSVLLLPGPALVDVATRMSQKFDVDNEGSAAVTSDAIYVTGGYWDVDVVGDDCTVTRVPRDGSTPKELATKLHSPTAIVVDEQFAFWVDHWDKSFSFVPVGGGEAKILNEGVRIQSLAVDDDAVYFATAKGIFRARKRR